MNVFGLRPLQRYVSSFMSCNYSGDGCDSGSFWPHKNEARKAHNFREYSQEGVRQILLLLRTARQPRQLPGVQDIGGRLCPQETPGQIISRWTIMRCKASTQLVTNGIFCVDCMHPQVSLQTSKEYKLDSIRPEYHRCDFNTLLLTIM